ncbi:Avirulence (Avh) protein [Phytophthora megakarya]|uniref:RxLR effector protein n=1 Tax=Phytophthora megakarya TaxID=4795 RepID=A0A225V5Z6_9STRA|nr:Avirulence (Avh) protein [Phytophthora megakarya]
MRLSFLALFAVVLVASSTAETKADQTGVSNVGAVHSSDVLAGEDKRFLRSHQAEGDDDDSFDDEDKRLKGDAEERAGGENLFGALKLVNMKNDHNYANKVFKRWKNYGHSVDDVEKLKVTKALRDKYETFLNTNKKSGWEYPHYRPINGYS